MPDDALFKSGSQETVKGTVHLLLHGLAASAAIYNAAAWLDRREPHLAVNTAVYTGLALFEIKQVMSHLTPK